MKVLNIELSRNGEWSKAFHIKDDTGADIDLTGAVFDMDVRFTPGETGTPLYSAEVDPVDLLAGKFQINIRGSDFADIGNKNRNTRMVYDLVATQDTLPIPLMKGEILLTPGVSDNAS